MVKGFFNLYHKIPYASKALNVTFDMESRRLFVAHFLISIIHLKMTSMNFIKTCIILFSALLVSQCGSTKQKEAMLVEAPFTVQTAYYQSWIAGMQEGGSGVNVYMSVSDLSSNIELKEGFFRNKVVQINQEDQMYVAKFLNATNSAQDLTMHSDVEEDAVNTPPAASKEAQFPFPLSDLEIGITFMDGDTLKYTKISNLKEKQQIAYPSAPPRNKNN